MKKVIILFTLAIIFHFLVWEAGIGLNMLVFSGITTALAFWLKPGICQRPMVRMILAGWCLSAVFAVWHHSILSVVAFWLFAIVAVGYLQQEKIRFWVIGLVESTSDRYSAFGPSMESSSFGLRGRSRLSIHAVLSMEISPT